MAVAGVPSNLASHTSADLTAPQSLNSPTGCTQCRVVSTHLISGVSAGLAELSERSVRSFELQASTAGIQLKQAAQAGSGAQFEQAAQHAKSFEHLSGMFNKALACSCN